MGLKYSFMRAIQFNYIQMNPSEARPVTVMIYIFIRNNKLVDNLHFVRKSDYIHKN